MLEQVPEMSLLGYFLFDKLAYFNACESDTHSVLPTNEVQRLKCFTFLKSFFFSAPTPLIYFTCQFV